MNGHVAGIIISTVLLHHHMFPLLLRSSHLLSFHRGKFCLSGGKPLNTCSLLRFSDISLMCSSHNFHDKYFKIICFFSCVPLSLSSLFFSCFLYWLPTQCVRGNSAFMKFTLCHFMCGTCGTLFFLTVLPSLFLLSLCHILCNQTALYLLPKCLL